jgi:hypothetical protein
LGSRAGALLLLLGTELFYSFNYQPFFRACGVSASPPAAGIPWWRTAVPPFQTGKKNMDPIKIGPYVCIRLRGADLAEIIPVEPDPDNAGEGIGCPSSCGHTPLVLAFRSLQKLRNHAQIFSPSFTFAFCSGRA